MAALPQVFSRFITVTIAFLALLLLEVVALIRAAIGTVIDPDQPTVSTSQFLSIIEQRSPTVEYCRGRQRQESKECGVCLSELLEGEMVRKLKCRHSFHKECLDEWLQRGCQATCPLCRDKVLPDKIVAKYQRHKQSQCEQNDEEIMFMLAAVNGDGLHLHGGS